MDFKYLIVFISLAAFASAELRPKDVPNHPDCPKVAPGPEEFPTFLPHPDECAAYYECDNAGNGIYMECPPHLHWNTQKTACDWPINVNCTKPNDIEIYAEPEEIFKTVEKFELRPEDIPNHPDCPQTPPEPEDHPKFLPSDRCESFYICDDAGNAIFHNCPPGLHWNREKTACDWPETAGCE